MLNISQTTTAHDLAQGLQGEEGLFLCRQGGQYYTVVAESGHSIKSGPTPVGPPIAIAAGALSAEPWVITKVSNSTEVQGRQPQNQPRSDFAGVNR